MKIEFARRASPQLATTLEYVHARNPQAAIKIAGRVEAAIRIIGEHPDVGRRQEQEGIRKFVVQPGGYVMFYTIDRNAERVRILFVTHPAQRRPYSDS